MDNLRERCALPEGWNPYKISELTNVRKQVCGENLTPYIEIGDVDVESKTYKFKDKKSVENSNIAKKDDVIISRVRPTRGAVSIIKEDEIYVSSAFTILAVKDDVFPEYLFYSIAYNKEFFSHLVKHQKGTSYPSCREKDILNFEIIVSPKNIQSKIIDILKKANETKKLRAQAGELTDRLLQSVFLEMFGDPMKNPKGWGSAKFGEIGTLQRGKSKHRPRNAPELLNGKYPLIQTGDVANSHGYVREYYQTYSELGLKQSKMWPAEPYALQ
jgi:type I restriction enzyme S subunit